MARIHEAGNRDLNTNNANLPKLEISIWFILANARLVMLVI